MQRVLREGWGSRLDILFYSSSHVAPAVSVENPPICFQRKGPVVLIWDRMKLLKEEEKVLGNDIIFLMTTFWVSTPSGHLVLPEKTVQDFLKFTWLRQIGDPFNNNLYELKKK